MQFVLVLAKAALVSRLHWWRNLQNFSRGNTAVFLVPVSPATHRIAWYTSSVLEPHPSTAV